MGLPRVITQSVGLHIEAVYRDSDKGVLEDVARSQRITEASLAAARALVAESTNAEGRVEGARCSVSDSAPSACWTWSVPIRVVHQDPRSLGRLAIVIDCNPEALSTNFDTSERLYFDELSHGTVLDVAELEKPSGVVVSVGGQTPCNLAMGLHRSGIKVLGTSVDAIDLSDFGTVNVLGLATADALFKGFDGGFYGGVLARLSKLVMANQADKQVFWTRTTLETWLGSSTSSVTSPRTWPSSSPTRR